MSRTFTLFLSFIISAFIVTACDAPNATAPATPLQRTSSIRAAREAGAPGTTALTWNVYVGADVERILQAQTLDEIVAISTEEWANVHATNFPARAGTIAANIAAARPDVVGLEEVPIYRTTDRPFEELATQVAYDYLQLVIDSLHGQQLDYTVVAVDRTTDIQVPVITGFTASGMPILGGVRYTDGDAVLVRHGIPYSNARSGVFAANLPVDIGGTTAVVAQGWSSVDATPTGSTGPYHFVVTHLAGQEVQDIQVAQTHELLALVAGEARPTILMGDFNSDAYGADPTRATPTYPMVLAAGFTDSWNAPDRSAPGLTCCEQGDLLNHRSTFNQRIDFIFVQNVPSQTPPVSRHVVGDKQSDRVLGLWPSDHAGVVATFGLGR